MDKELEDMKRDIKLVSNVQKLLDRKRAIKEAQGNTDSDMFDYYSELELERIDKIIAKYSHRNT